MELRDYLRVFRAHWLGMLAIVVGAVVVSFGWVILQPKVYTADATAIVRADTGTDSGAILMGNQIASQRVKTYVELGQSRKVAQRVIDELKLDQTPEMLGAQVSVTTPLDTPNLRVTADAPTPEKARDIAEAWVRSMAAEVNALETTNAEERGAVYLNPIDSARLPSDSPSPSAA